MSEETKKKEGYCSDCSNLDCNCFKEFVQNVSKRNVPNTSARTAILNDLYDLVGTMQYNIFSQQFVDKIAKNGAETAYIDTEGINTEGITEGITVENLKEKVETVKEQIISYIDPANDDDASDAYADAPPPPPPPPPAADAALGPPGAGVEANPNYRRFIERIYDQLEKNTFLYGKPNLEILFYEEKFYDVYESPLYVNKDIKFACGIFYNKNNLYICSSGLKNNVFNIFYALRSIVGITIPEESKKFIADSLIAALKVFIFINLFKINSFLHKNIKICKTASAPAAAGGGDASAACAVAAVFDFDYIAENNIDPPQFESHYNNLKLLFNEEDEEGSSVTETEVPSRVGKVASKTRKINSDNDTSLQFIFKKRDEIAEKKIEITPDPYDNIKSIIRDFNNILSRNGLLEFVNDSMKTSDILDFSKLISIGIKDLIFKDPESEGEALYGNTKKYAEFIIRQIYLPDVLILTDVEKQLYFIENQEYRDAHFTTIVDKDKRTEITGQYIPFKRLEENTVVCYNGSACVEPKLFNWLIKKGVIPRGGEGEHNFSCFWHGKKKTDEKSMLMYVSSKEKLQRKKLFLFGYYSYLLENQNTIPINSFTISKEKKFNPVFNNIMLPCSGCKINYNDILNNKIENENYKWDASSCEESMDVTRAIYTPASTPRPATCLLYAEEEEECEVKAGGKTKSSLGGKRINKSRRNKPKKKKTKRITKSKKAKTKTKIKCKKLNYSRKLY